MLSAERYVAIKQPFIYEAQVTEVRIIIGSALAWTIAVFLYNKNLFIIAILVVFQMLLAVVTVYFNISVYKEVRRQEKQIPANQVSLEAKEKILKNKKAFYTTLNLVVVI